MSGRGDGEILLDEVLKPAPPLGPGVLAMILGIVAAVDMAFALSFALRGAWPVMPFMGLDVALLAWAFAASRRAARREERVMLTPSLLRIAKFPPRGCPSEIEFNPYWVRVDMAEPPEHGSQLTVWSHGRGVRLGSFLPPPERASFARALKSALRAARARPM